MHLQSLNKQHKQGGIKKSIHTISKDQPPPIYDHLLKGSRTSSLRIALHLHVITKDHLAFSCVKFLGLLLMNHKEGLLPFPQYHADVWR